MEIFENVLLQFIHNGALLMEEFLAAESQRWQISSAEAKILLFLSCAPGMDTAKDIARHCGVSKASVSGNVLKLTARGLLTVAVDLKDRRFQHLKLTDQALPILEAIHQRMREVYRCVAAPLTPAEQAQLQSLLVRANMSLKNS